MHCLLSKGTWNQAWCCWLDRLVHW
jgi:hypothetical protein